MAKGGASESKTSKRMLLAIDKRVQALALRKAGVGFERIGQQLGCATSTAYQSVMKAIQDILQEPAEEVLKLELERLDSMLLGLWERARNGDYQAVATALKVEERRAKLLGLDAPEKSETSAHIEVSFVPIGGNGNDKGNGGNGNGRKNKK